MQIQQMQEMLRSSYQKLSCLTRSTGIRLKIDIQIFDGFNLFGEFTSDCPSNWDFKALSEKQQYFNEFYFEVGLLLGLQTVWLLCQYNGEQKWGGEQRKQMEFWLSKHFHNIVDIKVNNNWLGQSLA